VREKIDRLSVPRRRVVKDDLSGEKIMGVIRGMIRKQNVKELIGNIDV